MVARPSSDGRQPVQFIRQRPQHPRRPVSRPRPISASVPGSGTGKPSKPGIWNTPTTPIGLPSSSGPRPETCERWAVLDLEKLIAEGRGDYCFVGRKPRCSYCRGLGSWQLRPPTLRPGISARAYI